MRVLILEDDPNDLRLAADTAQGLGIADIDAFMWLNPAKACFQEGLRGDRPLPDAIILDLILGQDSGYESGFEMLRLWHSTRAQSRAQMIVWSQSQDWNREMCELFNVGAFVNKHEGPSALSDALRKVSHAA